MFCFLKLGIPAQAMLQGFELLYLFQRLTPPSLKPWVGEAVLEEG